jgi:hypothetical protein
MAVGSGIATQVVYKPEATFGVAPSLASTIESLEIKSETLELQKTTVQGQGLHAGGLYDRARRRVLTNYMVQGGITMDLQTRAIGTLIQYMVGSYGYTLATPAQIGATGIWKSVHWPVAGGHQGHSLTIQKGVPAVDGTVLPFTEVGCKISDWEISVATGALAQLVLTIDGRNELAGAGNSDPLNGSVPGLATFGTPTSGLGTQEFHFKQATIFTGGTPTVASNAVSLVGSTAAANVLSASIKQTCTFDTGRYFLGNTGFKGEQIENGFRNISGQLTVEWLSSAANYNAFAADTTTSLQLTFTGPTVSTSNYLLDIIVPNIKLDGESPKVGSPQVVQQALSFTGLDDEATTPIQITYQTEDTTL